MKKAMFTVILILVLFNAGFLFSNDINVKAFGNIFFGESKDIVEDKLKNNPEITLATFNFGDYLLVYMHLNVGSTRPSHNLYFHFYNNQLYSVEIRSPRKNANYFKSSIINFRNNFVNMIEAQYGAPSWTRNLEYFDIETGYIKWSHIWYAVDINEDKTIKIGLSVYEYEYYSVMKIEHPPLLEAKELESKQLEEEQTQKDSDLF